MTAQGSIIDRDVAERTDRTMLKAINTETSTGRIIWEKTLTDNWWGTYHDICVFSWCTPPKYFDRDGNQVSYFQKAVKMVCVDRQRNRTVTVNRV